METSNMMRVNAHPGAYGGHSASSQDRHHPQRHQWRALFDAVESGHLDGAKLAIKALMNFDKSLASDALFVRLWKLVEAGRVYPAQQAVREFKTKLVNAIQIGPRAKQPEHPIRHPRADGEHLIDTQA